MSAWQAGIVVITAAGNYGPLPMSVSVPGNNPYTVTVGAFTKSFTPEDRSDDRLAEFSAAGPTTDGFVKPDLIAPGGHMVSTMWKNSWYGEQYPENQVNPFYFQMSGTSMSTTVVSGVAALMLQKEPGPDAGPGEISAARQRRHRLRA